MKRFTETQAFPAFAYAVLLLTFAACFWSWPFTHSRMGLSGDWWLLILGAPAIALNLLCQKTVVTDHELSVTFGAVLPLYHKRFPLQNITAAEAATYAPITEYGGWGIRGWGRNTALNAHGSQGVRLTLQDGSRVLVGSQRPEELAQALEAD